jgi:hypothetical protein
VEPRPTVARVTGSGGVVREVVEVLGIYDADGGLRGEATYVVGKLLGRTHCSLCDITHSPVRRKRAWDDLVAASPVPVRVVHRNEMSAEERAGLAGVRLPVVAGRTLTGGWSVLITADELDALGGSVARFGERLGAVLGQA